jgi:uncharacterized protein YjdB
MRLLKLSAVATLVSVAACGGSDAGPTTVRTVAQVTISGSSTALNPGQTTQLTAVATDAAGATIADPGVIVWASGATTVATVDQSGKVTALSGGNTTITADVVGVKGSFLIRVNLSGGS